MNRKYIAVIGALAFVWVTAGSASADCGKVPFTMALQSAKLAAQLKGAFADAIARAISDMGAIVSAQNRE